MGRDPLVTEVEANTADGTSAPRGPRKIFGEPGERSTLDRSLLFDIIMEQEVRTMKAIQMYGYGDVDQLRYEDVPTPSAGAGEVLVRLAATSVNPIDWKIRRGDLKGMLTLQFPVIPGRDVAGEVAAVGANVSNFKSGQKVMALGNRTYAEFVAVPSAALGEVPNGLDLEQAAALPLVTTTGAQLMERVAPSSGQTVLVTGAMGSVGRSAVHVAIQRGAHVIAGVLERQKSQADKDANFATVSEEPCTILHDGAQFAMASEMKASAFAQSSCLPPR